MNRTVWLFLFVVVGLAGPPVLADCGSIPFEPGVEIFEPNQRAVLAYNGREEILLLSTDLRASRKTKVLEVIPFPSEPAVKKGNTDVFVEATRLINRKLQPRLLAKMGQFGGALSVADAARPPAGEVTLQKKIGAHDISVVRVLDRRRFVDWVKAYLKKSGVDNPTIPRPLELVVKEYLSDGFTWFAFNVVELGTDTVSKEAVQYRFATKFLYYPMRITRAETGQTTVRLIVLSPKLFKIPDRVRLVHQPVRITEDELRYLDKDMDKLLDSRPNMILRIWEIKGRLSSFKKDIVTTWF